MTSPRCIVAAISTGLFACTPLLLPGASPDREKDAATENEIIVLSPFSIDAGGFGATPGGAQDIEYFRMGVGRGEIPHPESITAEGLFSEHDLPLELKSGFGALFFVQTAAIPARFDVLPQVRYLAQLGFSSGLRAETWKPAPLNLVAVVDKSGSMSGEPLALVRASLLGALDRMRDGDQLSIVLYGDTSHVFLDPTVVGASSRGAMARRIRAIDAAGSTAMEAGLALGFKIARESAVGFQGNTRVMLFTDERPNVGNTAAEGFMGMAEAASRDGIGMTTIGVGVQFGTELATRISSVRGGNLFFFSDGEAMRRTFTRDFDSMVTELAHDFTVRIAPAAGWRVAGVFGVPGDMLRWEGDALVLDVATIFLSQRKGAIYFALAPDGDAQDLPARTLKPDEVAAQVDLEYRLARDESRVTASEVCRVLKTTDLQPGLRRGAHLVDQYLTLKKAATLHRIGNDQESAFRLVHGLLGRLTAAGDPALKDEVTLVTEMHNTLAFLSGHVGEMQPALGEKKTSPLVGVWKHAAASGVETLDAYLVIWPHAVLELVEVDLFSGRAERTESIALQGRLPRRVRGAMPLGAGERERFGEVRYELRGDTLTIDVANWEGSPARFLLKRCVSAEMAPHSFETEWDPEIDDISGLPNCSKPREITATRPAEWRVVAH